MAKGDYTDSSTRNNYKSKVRSQSLTKVSVSQDEKRARAELLDMIEELFQTTGSGSITAEKLRAFCHILVKSVNNSTDDSADADSLSSSCMGDNLPTSDPRSSGRLWNDRGIVKVSR